MKFELPCAPEDVEFVVWEDAVQKSWDRGHEEDIEKVKLAINVSIGWVVHKDKKRLVLANGNSTTGELDCLVVPVSQVLKRVPIIKKKSRR